MTDFQDVLIPWDPTEPETCKLWFVGVWFKNFADFLDGEFIIVIVSLYITQLVQVFVWCCEVYRHREIHKPSIFQIVNKARLFSYWKHGKLNSSFFITIFIQQGMCLLNIKHDLVNKRYKRPIKFNVLWINLIDDWKSDWHSSLP